MKKLFLGLLATLLLLSQEVYAAAAEAIFSASPHDRILLVLNNRPVNRTPAQKVMVRSRPGMHKVQIQVYNRWGQLKFVHHDKILIRPRTQNEFFLEAHPYEGTRLVAFSKRVRPRIPPKRVIPPPPVRHQLRLMEDQEFRDLMFTLQQLSSERAKMEVAKDALRNHYVYSEDVKEIMMEFAFEAKRLAFSKLAFRHVADPEQYEVVFEAFRYDSSIYQLQKYLERAY